MSNPKTSQLRRVSGSQLVYGDLIPIVDVSETTVSPTGETKAISAGDLASYVVSGGFLEVFTPMHGYQSANGLVFDQYIAPISDLNLRCYGEFCKVFMCGDPQQSDIGTRSGFRDIFNLFNDDDSKENGIYTFEFTDDDILRSALTKFIVKKIKRLG